MDKKTLDKSEMVYILVYAEDAIFNTIGNDYNDIVMDADRLHTLLKDLELVQKQIKMLADGVDRVVIERDSDGEQAGEEDKER